MVAGYNNQEIESALQAARHWVFVTKPAKWQLAAFVKNTQISIPRVNPKLRKNLREMIEAETMIGGMGMMHDQECGKTEN
jgi:hypothetical protein